MLMLKVLKLHSTLGKSSSSFIVSTTGASEFRSVIVVWRSLYIYVSVGFVIVVS